MSSKKYLDSPIFSIVCLPDSVLVSLGGGGKRFGLVNTLVKKLKIFDSNYFQNQFMVF